MYQLARGFFVAVHIGYLVDNMPLLYIGLLKDNNSRSIYIGFYLDNKLPALYLS